MPRKVPKFDRYADDITQVAGVLDEKRANCARAQGAVNALWNQIEALIPRYHAVLGGPSDRADVKGLNALVEVHHTALQEGKAAQWRLDQLVSELAALETVTDDPTFKDELSETELRARGIADDEAEASKIWEASKGKALEALPAWVAFDGGVEMSHCPRVPPQGIRSGMWVMADSDQSMRSRASPDYIPVYVLLESTPSPQGHRAGKNRQFYVWGRWSTGEGIYLVDIFTMRGLPPQTAR